MQLELLELENINKALSKGNTVLLPTDTIWGLSCDAHNKSAIERISEIKKRAPEKKYILLVSSIEMLKTYTKNIHPRVETLLSFHKKPTTCIYEASENVPKHLINTDGSIAIRLVTDSSLPILIEKFGRAIISTSANFNQQPFPTCFNDISQEFKETVDYIVSVSDAQKESKMTNPSVIIKYTNEGELVFLRT